jgi:hypothetical protein
MDRVAAGIDAAVAIKTIDCGWVCRNAAAYVHDNSQYGS